MQLDLSVDSYWKVWTEEKPRLQEDIFVIGKLQDGSYPELNIDLVVRYDGFPEYIMLESGGYQYTGNLTNFNLFHSKNCSLRFYPEEHGFEVEYWIYLNDLLPYYEKNN